MRAFFGIAYFVVGIVQFFAVWDGAEYFFGTSSSIGTFFSFWAAIFVTYIPLVGSGLGVYGAVQVWDWTLLKSLILFFWYVPVYVAAVLLSREGS